jgi:hypothetical protein
MNTRSEGREGPRSKPDSTIAPKVRAEHNAVVRNLGNRKSLRLAIDAMCHHCMGCTAAPDYYEPGTKEEIRNCSAPKCPLWHFRPYKPGAGS